MQVRNISPAKAKPEQFFSDFQQMNTTQIYIYFQTKYCWRLVSLDNSGKKQTKNANKTLRFKLYSNAKASKQEYLLSRHDYEVTIPQETPCTEACMAWLGIKPS